jgi:hypothetical protein
MSSRQRCTDHCVTGCLICFPVARKTSPGTLPEVPSFPAADDISSNPVMDKQDFVEKYIAPIQLIERPSDIATTIVPMSPLVDAAVRFTNACNVHVQAQRDVARLKEQLAAAQAHEEKMHAERIQAQGEMALLVEEAK